MGKPSKQHIINILLKDYGRLYSKELGISLHKGTPSALFQWLIASLLFSVRIGSSIAVEAAQSLNKRGWKTAQRMAQSTGKQRVQALHEAGYSRYQEKTATMLGDTANLLIDQYGGDIRKLRQTARNRPDEERRLLKECKGLGNTGVDIFFREMQVNWKELAPFADKRALRTAKKLKLGHQTKDLAKLTTGRDFPKLIAALVRVKNDKLDKEVLAKASK
jgi:hypothetical protein